MISARAGEVRSVIAAQLERQHHRGPDAAGYFDGGRGVIAQNRLAIIDLVAGDPPITNESGSIGAVLNGEIYNFERLSEGLKERGHRFSSRGDTEVIAHLAEEASEAVSLARQLDGMFAFAVWDREGERLVLGRDRVGKKPLYYWHSDDRFVFASEIKGVLADPAVPATLDEQALSAYLTFGYVPTPRTFFAGVRSLPPAHVLTMAPGGEPTIQRYWKLLIPGRDDVARLPLDLDEAAEELKGQLQAAIRRRLISDVPLGAFLSGGIDSSAIVALMAGVMGEPVKTFTIGFDDQAGFDERPFARAVAERYGTEHHEHVVHPDAIELVERLVWHHDQPFGDSSAIPTYLLNQVAREHVTVALAGDGGDELFGGYERFAGGLAVDRYLSVPRPLRETARRALRAAPSGLFRGRAARLERFAAAAERGMPWAYLEWISFVPEDWRQRLLKHPDEWGRADYQRRWDDTSGLARLDRLLEINLETYLPDDLLVKMDRTSMAHGLEVRSPFLDTQLLEFSVRLAPELKVKRLDLKRVLKHALRDLLPDEILSRPKRGFGVPLDRWFREDLEGYAKSMLGRNARVREHVNGEQLDRLMGQHWAASANHGHALWTLLTLELFLRRYGW